MRTSSLVLLLAASCTLRAPAADRLIAELGELSDDAGSLLEAAPPASPRDTSAELPDELTQHVDSYFADHGSRRLHVQLDRPLYRPGETVWIKSWSVRTRGLEANSYDTVSYELVSPRGDVAQTKQVPQANGTASNDFVLPADASGGKWLLRATLASGELDERPFIVSSYQAPTLRKKLEFVREAYGPGERVEALVEIADVSGPLADHPVRALLQVAGQTVLETTLRTDASGAVLVQAALPSDLSSSDGLLSVLIDRGGVTESISRSLPIVLADLQLSFFPEGGDLVQGLPGRVYFEAKNQHGEPADVAGTIVDDRGQQIASFSSVHDGLGRVAITPRPGRSYSAHITSPPGIDTAFPLPHAQAEGCVLHSYDDLKSRLRDVRVGVRCSSPRELVVAGVLREQAVDVAAVRAGPDRDTLVYLHPSEAQADQQGALRVTVFDRLNAKRRPLPLDQLVPLAERLIYRNPGRDLTIQLSTDKERYGPRDQVVVDVRTSDPSGEPVAAELALSVVDDSVLSFADDKEGHMLSRLYLAPELVDSPKDPAFYFDPEEQLAARGLDLVMGTKGWRRFDWAPVWNPPAPVVEVDQDWDYAVVEAVSMHRPRFPRLRGALRPVPDASMGAALPPMAEAEEVRKVRAPARKQMAQGRGGVPREEMWGGPARGDLKDILDEDRARDGLIAVRIFPKPDYRAGFTGTRSDFRDTVHWEPSVQTDAKGHAEVRFYLNDAITSFRVTAEGLGAEQSWLAGHAEASLSSVLPVSLQTRLPSVVSAGDQLLLPVTVANLRSSSLEVALSGSFDPTLLSADQDHASLRLAPNSRDTWWVPLNVNAGAGVAPIRLSAEGGGLSDTLERSLQVVPIGFPRSWSAAGTSAAKVRLRLHLDDDIVPDSLMASVTWHPSPVSNLITGMEGLIRQPGGCFEQTSSTNWPNVSILNYLEAHEGDPRLRVQSSQALETGYNLLTGYQIEAGGFETFGNGPGKEALSAFGLLQFTDMKKVYPVDDKMLKRDVDYLLAQRDGDGGFKNSGASSHGYGSAPADVLNGFITYALVATGHSQGLDREISKQAEVARSSQDPYVLALAARSLQGAKHPGADRAIERLLQLQADDGSFPGAESSITRSYEANLLVESTAIAALALMSSGRAQPAADKAVDWLIGHRQGGTWGATQATALALSALTEHAELNRAPRQPGRFVVEVNGEQVGRLSYQANQTAPLVISGLGEALRSGDNTIVLRQERGEPLPYSVEVNWHSDSPSSAEGAELALWTELDRAEVKMGETVRLSARIDNRTQRVVPSPIARIGLPAGLEAQSWQLRQLQDRGEIAFFETRPREVTLYWEGLHAGDQHQVQLDLVATVPGVYTAPASSAYPYYNDDEKAWDAGQRVRILRP